MIKVIPGERRGSYPRLIDEMHKLRRSVFHERLQWQVPTINHWEVDGYDALNPLYVLALDSVGMVNGGLRQLRLLPTTGFSMLNDTFPELLPEGLRIQSPLIWESSRFTVRMTGERVSPQAIGRATAELAMALNEIGKAAGLSHTVTVTTGRCIACCRDTAVRASRSGRRTRSDASTPTPSSTRSAMNGISACARSPAPSACRSMRASSLPSARATLPEFLRARRCESDDGAQRLANPMSRAKEMSEMIHLVTDQDLSNRTNRPRRSAQDSALALCKRITCSIFNIAVQEIELHSAQRRATQIFYADPDAMAALTYTPRGTPTRSDRRHLVARRTGPLALIQ